MSAVADDDDKNCDDYQDYGDMRIRVMVGLIDGIMIMMRREYY